jgi:2-polyprenyl-3-methyl-5-hydroxy-6-metoxy-1,4-benzoquinol methylase
VTEQFDAEWWEQRYRSHGVHHAEPTPALLAEVADLAPGRALDAGCGEGVDAVWLAAQGWRVTAVDISATALRTARSHAASSGAEVADRIDWVHADLADWTPEVRFDLVASSYVHPPGSTADLVAWLAAAVAPGGTLLVVGHQHQEHPTSDPHAPVPESHIAVDDVAAVLDPAAWEVVVAEVRHRTSVHDGDPVELADAVLRARRRP